MIGMEMGEENVVNLAEARLLGRCNDAVRVAASGSRPAGID